MRHSLFTWSFLLLCSFYGFTQENEELTNVILDYFEPEALVEVKYDSYDFQLHPKKPKALEELSLEHIQELKDSLKLTDDKALWMRLGMLYKRMNRTTESREFIAEAIKRYSEESTKNPKDRDLLDALFMMYYSLGDFQHAEAYNDQILGLHPKDTAALIFKGFIKLNQGDLAQAVSNAEEVMEKVPQLPTPYFVKIMAMLYKDMVSMQNSVNEKGEIEWRPISVETGFLHELQKKFPDNLSIEAMVLCSEFLLFYYDAMIPIMQMGDIEPKGFKFPLTGEQKKTLNVFEKRFEKLAGENDFDNYYTTEYSLGLIELLRSDYEKAMPHFEKAIKHRGQEYRGSMINASSVYDNLIACYLFLGNIKSASEWQAQKVKDRASVDPVAKDILRFGLFELHNGNLIEGDKLLLEALEVDPQYYEVYTYLIRSKLLQDDKEAADKYMRLAYDQIGQSKNFRRSIVFYSLYSGDKGTASYLIDEFLKDDPSDIFANDVKTKLLK